MIEGNGEGAGVMPAELQHLITRADSGDRSALPELRQWLDHEPRAWALTGDLGHQTQQALLDKLIGGALAARETIERKANALRLALCGPSPSAAEILLAERVVISWLHLYCIELAYAQRTQGLTPAQLDYYERRLNHSHRRFISAIRALVQVQRLSVPAVQLNVGNQQINVAR